MRSFSKLEWLLIGLGALGIAVLYEFILPMIMGAVMALMLHPVHERLRSYRPWPRTWSALLVVLVTLGLLVPVFSLLISGGSDLLNLVKLNYDKFLQAPASVLSGIWQQWPWFREVYHGLDGLLEVAVRTILSLLQQTLFQMPKIFLNLGVSLATAYVCLAHKESLKNQALTNSWLQPQENLQIMQTVQEVTYSVIWASLVAGVLQCVIMVLGLGLIGNPQWLILGGLTFLFAFMPVIGTSPISLGLLFFYAQTKSQVGIITMVVIIALLLVVDNILRSYLIGNRAKIHPLLAFVSALGGLTLFGFYGLFLGPIVVGTWVALHQKFKA